MAALIPDRSLTTASLRELLNRMLQSDADLDAFCLDHFPDIKRRFTAGMERQQKLNLLLEGSQPAQIRDWLQQSDPQRFNQHAAVLRELPVESPIASDPELARRIDELESLEIERGTARAAGESTAALDKKIVALKRAMRTKPRLQEGESLGQYKLLKKIGDGGFATVYQAWDSPMRRMVAIKVLHPQLCDSAEKIERFDRGARKMAACHHPHIVRVIADLKEEDGFHFYVMDYLAGGTLHQRVTNDQLSAELALKALLDVGSALDYTHSQKIIHRDVKPQNIIFDELDRAYLSDFDLAWAADTTGGTRTGAFGTMAYAAPEVTDGGGELGPTADVYSLGMTAAFTWQRKDLPSEALRNINSFWQSFVAPPKLKSVLTQATQLDPRKRFQSVSLFCQALAAAWKPVQTASSAPASSSPLEPTPLTEEVIRFLKAHQAAICERYGYWEIQDALIDPEPKLAWAASVPLRSVYFPLRIESLRQNEQPTVLEWQHGAPATAAGEDSELDIKRTRHMLLLAQTGSGKTSWVRKEALRLAETQEALPLLVQAPMLAKFANQSPGLNGEALIAEFLSQDWKQQGGPEASRIGLSLLDAAQAPRPVLFLDGWEDLSGLADRVLRALTAFIRRYPRLLVCVTTQPQATRLPTTDFERFTILVPSPGAIDLFRQRIDAAAAERAPALVATPNRWRGMILNYEAVMEIRDLLVPSALFLTQALLLDLVHPLPEARHRVYDTFLRNLATRYDRKQAAGAQPQGTLWYPESVADRLLTMGLIAMDLAFSTNRSPIQEVIARCFPELSIEQREGLLEWLLGPAAFLVEQHGQYQVLAYPVSGYLISWFCSQMEEQQRNQALLQMLQDRQDKTYIVRQTGLLLDLAGQQSLLQAIYAQIAASKGTEPNPPDILSLAGAMIAYGLGSLEDCADWVERALSGALSSDRVQLMRVAWRVTNQEDRRSMLDAALTSRVAAGDGFEWARLSSQHKYMHVDAPPLLPGAGTMARLLIDAIQDAPASKEAIACGRIFGASWLLWPAQAGPLMLLSVWPSFRRLAAQRAQTLVCLGWSKDELLAHASALLTRPQWDPRRDRVLMTKRPAGLPVATATPSASQDANRELICDWLSVQPSSRVSGLLQNRHAQLEMHHVEGFWSHWTISQYWNSMHGRQLAHGAREACLLWTKHLFDLQKFTTREQQLLRVIDNCSARVGPRALLAHLPSDSSTLDSPQVHLLSQACLLSLHPNLDRDSFEQALRDCAGSESVIWRDLSQYLVGEADSEALRRLHDPISAYGGVTSDPMQVAGLHYLVAGQIWLPDGSDFSIDEIAFRAGIPSLPYLDELPPLSENAIS